jgi:hypothetical protein
MFVLFNPRLEIIPMTAIVYGFIRATSQPSNLAVALAVSLAGLVMTFTALRFGLDFGPGIPG